MEPADPVRLRDVRAIARDWLAASARVPPSAADDLVLMVSELWTNAVQASPPASDIELSLTRENDTIVVDTVDSGPGFTQPVSGELPEPDSVDGRGLALVRLLGGQLSWGRAEGRTLVRAVYPLAV